MRSCNNVITSRCHSVEDWRRLRKYCWAVWGFTPNQVQWYSLGKLPIGWVPYGCFNKFNKFPETLLSEMFLVSMMITDFSFCSGVASLGSDCMLSWSLWMFRWFWIVNHQNCCSNNSSFMAGRVKHLCQEWSITIWLVLIKFWQVPWNVRLREWPIIGNGEAICVQVNTTWLIVTMCCHGYKISAFEHFHVNSRFRLSTDGSGLGKRFSRYADDQSVPWRLIYACFKLQFAHKSKFYKTSCRYLAYSTLSYLKSYWEE